MTNHAETIAQQVVTAFKAELDPRVRERITSAQYERLHQLVSNALSQELRDAAEQVEQLVKKFRADAGSPGLEL
jgi:hypothetical protein